MTSTPPARATTAASDSGPIPNFARAPLTIPVFVSGDSVVYELPDIVRTNGGLAGFAAGATAIRFVLAGAGAGTGMLVCAGAAPPPAGCTGARVCASARPTVTTTTAPKPDDTETLRSLAMGPPENV